MHAIKVLEIIQTKKLRWLAITCLQHLPEQAGSCSSSFMEWEKVSLVMVQAPGYCTWLSSFLFPTCGESSFRSGRVFRVKHEQRSSSAFLLYSHPLFW